jgi:N-acetylneuraminate epimerase
MNKLLRLTPVTLGELSGFASDLSATVDAAQSRWRVTWRDASGQPVQAECAVGGSDWSPPSPVPGSAAQVFAATALPLLSGGAFPDGILVWQQHANGCVAIRSGRRVPGRPPRFPSASLILCGEISGAWSDLGFADEAPGLEIAAVALAVAPDFWLAAYLAPDGSGRNVCRVVQAPTALRPVPPPETWWRLPSYPQAPGMAGLMAGSHGDVLIAAGGANFPDLAPWQNGTKKFYDEIYALLPGEAAWKAAGRLPAPRAYGAPVNVPDGVLIAGGENGERVFQDSLLLQWDGRRVQVRAGPPLPAPATCAVAAVLDGCVYLAGGYSAGAPRLSRDFFWRLNLKDSGPSWRPLPAWPGPTRALAVIAAVDAALYLLSGIEIADAGQTPPQAAPAVYLKDAYRYRPGGAWERLPELPWSALAAPSPAPVSESPARVFVLGGVDGRQVGNLPRATVLPDDIIYLDVSRNEWRHWPEAWPTPVVCISTIKTGDRWVLPSGETMAGKRTTAVRAWRIAE